MSSKSSSSASATPTREEISYGVNLSGAAQAVTLLLPLLLAGSFFLQGLIPDYTFIVGSLYGVVTGVVAIATVILWVKVYQFKKTNPRAAKEGENYVAESPLSERIVFSKNYMKTIREAERKGNR